MTLEKKYYHKVLGFNYRMTSMQAAIGIEQLKKLNYILKKKNKLNLFIKVIYHKKILQFFH